MVEPSAEQVKNRADWDAGAEGYQRQHGEQLAVSPEPAWGAWQISDSEVGAFGDPAGVDILELGCGGGQTAAKLAKAGANITALDISAEQLEHAKQACPLSAVSCQLIHADAEDVPLSDESFDLVFSDHGAFSFCEPARVSAEAARLLRPGGRLAFNVASPWLGSCYDPDRGEVGERLTADYFGRRRLEDEHSVEFRLEYGEWIRLLRSLGLTVTDLVELRPPAGARTSYDYFVSLAWARRWPGENVWKATKEET